MALPWGAREESPGMAAEGEQMGIGGDGGWQG